jgi:hypothetical protein
MSAFSHHANLSQPEIDVHRQAYNAAFEELGLSWHWDSVTFAGLAGAGPDRVRAYIQQEHPHLLRAYEADFLVEAIETAKARCHAVMSRGRVQAPWMAQSQGAMHAAQTR